MLDKYIKFHERATQLLRAAKEFEAREKLLLSRSKEMRNGRHSIFKKEYEHDSDIAGRAKNRMLQMYMDMARKNNLK